MDKVSRDFYTTRWSNLMDRMTAQDVDLLISLCERLAVPDPENEAPVVRLRVMQDAASRR